MEGVKNTLKAFTNPLERGVLAINDSFGYELEGKDRISIHISHNAAAKSLGEKLSLLKKSFNALAQLLLGLEELKDVKLITATSWIVTEKPKLLRRLGFITENSSSKYIDKYKAKYKERILKLNEHVRELHRPDVEPGYAYISKEKFLELYGNLTGET